MYFQFAINLAFCQEYGLEFLGHEVITDKRTSLILGDENNFCTKSDLELAFEIKFKPNVSSYFGYVFRIIDQDNKNIDLLFQSDSKGKQQKFRIISGDKDIKLEKQLDSVTLYSKWNLFKVQIEDNQLKIFCNNQLYGKGAIPFSFKKCFKIYFGECSHPKFLTSDVLPMYLRNVTIKSANELLHHWPLREIYGNNSMDNVAQSKAISKNAQWLLKNHFEWKLLKKLKFKGNSSFAFNDKSRVIQINSDLKTYFFSTKNDSLSYKNFTSSHKKFTFGDCAIFLNNKLVNVRLNERQIFDYDFNKNNWNISANTKYNLTEYWHHNKYAYPNDTALVLIGGYGQYKYKNRVQKFSFNTNSWSDLSMTGDIIEPRYMFGLGSKENMKSYLFGGFGSKTGDQGMNPQNYYDLFEIDWQKNRVRKVYDLKNPDSTFVVASSLIVNQSKDSFYGLIYNQLKFKSSLQLVEGSLSKPELNRISKEIPYKFIDVSSFADLYFDKINSKLYCVTSFFDRLPADSTEIEIYSLDFPPSNLPVVAKNNPSFFQSTVKFGLFAVLILTVLFGVIWYLINNNYQSNLVNEENVALNEESEIPQEMHDNIINVGNENKGKISLFGGFQFINNNGVDLTNQFSPLLKEMFLYLLLNSIKWNKGVNSSQLNDMFWNDKTTSSARNNRSVNITKLKTIFEQLPAIQITKDTGNWKIVFEPSKVSIDYFEFQKLTNAKKTLNVEQINDLTSIVNQGAFLSNLEYEWLDDFKAEISNKVIDAYLAYSEQLPISQYAEEIIEIADNIFKFDSVDETAMSLKCKSLVYLGKHSLAKSSYEKFAKDYQRLYSEEYEVSYKEILES
ncbi:hypothetical protein [Emticicia aquatica]|uniref:hypothetical protein n=1 Tax=Emticicia aquatica TaxID=1681835 RepID=UPI001EEB29AC|nr:hypothetical protein [Emticicia aquatica]